MLSFNSCSKSIDEIRNRTWEGQLYRSHDNKKLSDIKFKMTADTLFIFSNAIFGIGNDTLVLASDNKKDSTSDYKNSSGDVLTLKYKYTKSNNLEKLYLLANDFYIESMVSSIDIRMPKTLDFFNHLKLPRNVDMYLDGAYEGEFEMENQAVDLFFSSIGGAKVKMVFMDGFKVKIYFKSLAVDMFSNSPKAKYEIVNYKIVGNKLILENNKNKSKTSEIEVRNNGETLVIETNEMNAILHKLY